MKKVVCYSIETIFGFNRLSFGKQCLLQDRPSNFLKESAIFVRNVIGRLAYGEKRFPLLSKSLNTGEALSKAKLHQNPVRNVIKGSNKASIGRLVSHWAKDSLAADLRRKTAKQLLSRGPIAFGLIGVYVQSKGPKLFTVKDEIEARCDEIKSIFNCYFNNYNAQLNLNVEKLFSFRDLKFDNFIAKGCNAVVYSAKIDNNNKLGENDKNNENEYAVKMMFNYDAESNAYAIWQSMKKECITLDGDFSVNEELDRLLKNRKYRLKPHPNIIKILGVFTDQIPKLPNAEKIFPLALPVRLFEGGLGRNMSLFLVMKKYDTNLDDFLRKNQLDCEMSLFLLSQLFEAIAFLVKQKIAHRDLKCDNILLDTSTDSNRPWLVLTDFGFCSTTLSLPFPSDEISRGGNTALMAPEVYNAVPGTLSVIDYRAADLWTCGTIAYQIFNCNNPFYKNKSGFCLISSIYDETDLPKLPDSAPAPLSSLISCILKRDPKERPNAKTAATLCQMLLFASNRSLSIFKVLKHLPEHYQAEKLLQWLRNLSTTTLVQRKTVLSGKRLSINEMRLRLHFLSDVSMQNLLSTMQYF